MAIKTNKPIVKSRVNIDVRRSLINKYLGQETYSENILLNVIVNKYSVIITHLSDKRVGQN